MWYKLRVWNQKENFFFCFYRQCSTWWHSLRQPPTHCNDPLQIYSLELILDEIYTRERRPTGGKKWNSRRKTTTKCCSRCCRRHPSSSEMSRKHTAAAPYTPSFRVVGICAKSNHDGKRYIVWGHKVRFSMSIVDEHYFDCRMWCIVCNSKAWWYENYEFESLKAMLILVHIQIKLPIGKFRTKLLIFNLENDKREEREIEMLNICGFWICEVNVKVENLWYFWYKIIN